MINKRFLLLFIFVSAIYFVTRLVNINTLPVFGDEAIYMRWSQIIRNVETLRFIPLNDGKQPLYMWLVVPLLKYLPPLMAGRLLSVFSGYLTMILLAVLFAIYQNYSSKNQEPLSFVFESLNKYLYSCFVPVLIYIFLPFAFFFDRLAVPDNLLSAFGLLSIILAILLAKFPRLDLTMLLGFTLGLAWVTKSPAIYFVVLSLLAIFLLGNIKKIYFPLTSALIAYSIFNLLRLGPQFHQIALRNLDYVWSLKELSSHPFDPLKPHFFDLINLYTKYISLPFFLIFFIKYKKFNKILVFILLTFLLPLIANMAIAKVFTGRYILFTIPYLIILISVGIVNFPKKYSFLILLLFLPNIYYQYQLSFNPYNTSLPKTDLGYTSGWTAGWGIEAISNYLIDRSKNNNVIVGTEGYFGTFPDGLQIYTDSVPQLTVFGVNNDLVDVPEKLIDARNHGDEVYVIKNSSKNEFNPQAKELMNLVSTHKKPDGSAIYLYQLK